MSDFVGRTDILERIEAGFQIPSERSSRIIVLHGLGGQGKTQIALEVCRRSRANGIESIFWVDANSADTVKKSFKIIAETVKSPDEHIGDDATEMVLRRFRDWPKSWIMVFDNYDDVRAFDNIADLIPDAPNGRVLITSRHSESAQLASREGCAIELHGLAEDDALEVLFKNAKKPKTDKDLEHAKRIVKRLVYHPLAIAQAGSYIRQKKIHLDQFIGYYEDHRDRILQHTPLLTRYRRHLDENQRETSLNVFTTWELSFEQLLNLPAGDNKAALLTLFAFFDCKDISEELFSVYTTTAQTSPSTYRWPVKCLAHCLGEKFKNEKAELEGWNPHRVTLRGAREWNNETFLEIVDELSQMSLVQSWSRGPENLCHLTLHPLVRDWIRLRTKPNICHNFCIV